MPQSIYFFLFALLFSVLDWIEFIFFTYSSLEAVYPLAPLGVWWLK